MPDQVPMENRICSSIVERLKQVGIDGIEDDNFYLSRPWPLWEEELDAICVYMYMDRGEEKDFTGDMLVEHNAEVMVEIIRACNDDLSYEPKLNILALKVMNVLLPLFAMKEFPSPEDLPEGSQPDQLLKDMFFVEKKIGFSKLGNDKFYASALLRFGSPFESDHTPDDTSVALTSIKVTIDGKVNGEEGSSATIEIQDDYIEEEA